LGAANFADDLRVTGPVREVHKELQLLEDQE